MPRSTPLIAAGLAALLSLGTAAAHAGTGATVMIQAHAQIVHPVQYQQPPAPRYERVPPPRRGAVWSRGHWEWRGHRYAWVPGQWVQARHGHRYRQPHWEQRQGQWHFTRGGWDRDGDGVPNRYDRQPDNPRRR